MYDYKLYWKEKIAFVVNTLLTDADISEKITPEQVIAEDPPNPELGDIGFPMFSFSKILRKGPPQIAQIAAEKLAKLLEDENSAAKVQAQGPYLNVRMDRAVTARTILENVTKDSKNDFSFGRPGSLAGKRVMVEFSSPNTNKPLHLGHLRNDVLGESVSRILAACGAEVKKFAS